ncbi:hypothetical protein ACFV9W_16620 [Streptomyces sp. NPDC059897]|uniref:hypothetical protein n=1 Tax=Streptomyces sp. NPDC059897 TaxID=3346994 RepID=UPI00364981C4
MVNAAQDGGGASGGGQGEKWDTPFNMNDLDKLKQMVADAKPQTVKEVAQNWTEVHEHLVGSDGSGGLKKQFDDAVKKVLEKWKGSSADKFMEEAGKISQEMATGGNFAKLAGDAMDHSADQLYQIQDQIQSIDVSWWDEAWDTATDMFTNMTATDYAKMIAHPASALYADYQLYQRVRSSEGSIQADLASGISSKNVLDRWGDKMGAKQQAALQAAMHMESLGSTYKSNASSLKNAGPGETFKPPKVDNPGGGGDMNVPGAGGANPGISGGAGIGGGGAGQGIPGFRSDGLKPPTASGAGLPDASQIGTGLDSAGPGLGGGAGSGAGLGAGGGLGGGAGTGAGGAGAGLGGGMAGGIAGGMAGGAAGLARGAGAGGAAGRGAGAAGRGTGAGAGRGMMGGMGGGAGAGGAAGRGAGAAGRTGAAARTKGGMVGGAKGKSGGAFTPGGTGLRNRGVGTGGTGSGAGSRGQNGRSGFGPAGAGAAGRGTGREREGNNSRRPDYLVEDETTWAPKQRKANPPVIE